VARAAFGETYSGWALRLREDYSQRQRSARRTSANGSSSSAWPTPQSRDGKGVDRQDVDRGNARPLNEAVAMWSTPTAHDGRRPGADVTSTQDRNLSRETAQWVTPRSHECGQYQYSKGDKAKPTPTLTGQMMQWPTPSVADVTGGHTSRGGHRTDEPLMNARAVQVSSHLGRATSKRGAPSPNSLLTSFLRYRATTDSALRSERRALLLMAIRARGRGWTRTVPTAFVRPSFRRSLNHHFVAWLMGWPPPASIGCGFSGTEWFRWWGLSRCALSQTASPRPAPPAQLSLWG
jgi:hypothetical protein